MAIAVKTKQWGNSLGIILPNELVTDLSLNPGEEIILEITKKQNVLKELFGTVRFKRKTQEILQDVRKELGSKWI